MCSIQLSYLLDLAAINPTFTCTNADISQNEQHAVVHSSIDSANSQGNNIIHEKSHYYQILFYSSLYIWHIYTSRLTNVRLKHFSSSTYEYLSMVKFFHPSTASYKYHGFQAFIAIPSPTLIYCNSFELAVIIALSFFPYFTRAPRLTYFRNSWRFRTFVVTGCKQGIGHFLCGHFGSC